jgi:hypothetical protein
MASMVLPVVGLAGAGAAVGAQADAGSMPGMGPTPSNHPGGILGVLVIIGPELLVASIILVTVSLTLRRRGAAFLSLVAGAMLYWGMYAQGSVTLMYTTMAGGYVIWALTYLWTPLDHPSTRTARAPAC